MKLTVREINGDDIPKLCDYWLNSSADHLVGMGVDLAKIPSRKELSESLLAQIDKPYKQKKAYALIWEIEGQACGHTNVNQIVFGKEAFMHLHLWNESHRAKGIGAKLLSISIPIFFDKLSLSRLYCEPYAKNPAPNKTLAKLGFKYVKSYETIPGTLNFLQVVNRWKFEKEDLLTL